MSDIVSRSPSGDNGATGRLVATVPADSRQLQPADGRYPMTPAGFAEAAPGLGDSLLEIRRMLSKRKWLIMSITALTITLGFIRAVMETPLYAATVRLQIERNVVKVVEGGSTSPIETNDTEFLRTQYELLLSRSMADRAVASLQLGENADFLRSRSMGGIAGIKRLLGFGPGTGANSPQTASPASSRAAVGIVLAGRTVKPNAGSRMVDIIYQDPDPVRAQQVTMAMADAFIASNVDKRFQANAYAKTFLEDQIAQLKLKLSASENAMLDFAEKEKIVVVNERASVAENNLAAANTSLSTLVQDRIKSEELWKQVESNGGINLPQFLSNAAIEALRTKRSGLVTEYQQKLETFKPGYPAMVQINNQISDIDRQLAAETKAIKASLKGAYEAALGQEQETRKRVDELKAELLDLQKRSIQYNLLKREVDTTRTLYDGLLQRFKEVDIAGGVGTNNVFIVDKAEVPALPVSPVLSQALFLATLLGFGIALTVAYLLEYLDDAVRSAETVERLTGLTILGIIPKPSGKLSVEQELADPSSSISEAYRSLATSLQLSTDRGLPKSLLVTSAAPSEGKSSTAVGLARHYATMGLKVLLVDADLRNPSLHKKLGTSNTIGFSTYLAGACAPPEAFQATSVPNLAFMPSGPLPPNAADLLSSPRLLSLLSVGLEVFDCIILDGPPTMGIADAQLLANAAQATALVVSAGETRAGLLKGALKRLTIARGTLIGTILTKYDARSAGYEYGYGYGYGHGYNYGGGYGARPAAIEHAAGASDAHSQPAGQLGAGKVA